MTKGRKPARLRYDEGCLAAHALNVIGDRWALLVVRELMFAAKRFQAIRAGLPGITASVLTQRLAQLAEAGVVVQNPALGFFHGAELMALSIALQCTRSLDDLRRTLPPVANVQ